VTPQHRDPATVVTAPAASADGERGSASIWVLTGAALVLLIAVTTMVRTSAVLARHRAEFTADAAALAAAAQIGVSENACAAATQIAQASGARVRSCVLVIDVGGRSGTVEIGIEVDVRLPLVGAGRVVASARARRDAPSRSVPPP
jgi:secretion/DNA translocation related TadE-like protein